MEMFEEAGVPPGVLNYLPGHGSVIGQHLVDHPEVVMIAFTGSREVGLRIWESAGKTQPGQRELKTRRLRDGRQERHHRRFRCRPRRDRSSTRFTPPSVTRAEMFRALPAHCARRGDDRVMERLLAAAASLRVGNPEDPGITVGP